MTETGQHVTLGEKDDCTNVTVDSAQIIPKRMGLVLQTSTTISLGRGKGVNSIPKN